MRKVILRFALFVLSLTPSLWVTLFAMAFAAAWNALGHVPVPMIDDPKLMAPHDANYQAAYDRLIRLDERAVIACCFAWFFLFLETRRPAQEQ